MNSNIIYGPWTGRMTLDDFYSRANQYLVIITSGQKSLVSLLKLLRAGESIDINQWKYTVNVIPQLSVSIQNFCQLLETPTELPEVVIPARYLLATALYDVDEQINELTPVITKLSANFHKHPRKVVNQDFRYRLRQLIKGCNEIREAYSKLVEKLFTRTSVVRQFRNARYMSHL